MRQTLIAFHLSFVGKIVKFQLSSGRDLFVYPDGKTL